MSTALDQSLIRVNPARLSSAREQRLFGECAPSRDRPKGRFEMSDENKFGSSSFAVVPSWGAVGMSRGQNSFASYSSPACNPRGTIN